MSLRRARCAALAIGLGACASVGTPGAEPDGAPDTRGSAFGVVAQTLLDSAASKYRRVARTYDPARGVPRSTRPDGSWSTAPVSDWTSGFYAGTLWYLHEYSLDPVLRAQAERFTLPIAAVAGGEAGHDPGSPFVASFGNAYRITRDERFHAPLVDAARQLAGRYDPEVGAIRSSSRGDWTHPVLIETLVDLELLMWGAAHGGDAGWAELARTHGRRTLASHVRPDGGTFQLVDFDPRTGALLRRAAPQGAGDSTTWARGHAWGIYGFTVLYRFTRDPRFLSGAERLAVYALRRLPDDHVPCWDYQAPGCPDRAQRDASAAAIMASALLELSTFVRGESSARYREAAEAMLESLASPSYLAPNGSSALLLHSVGDHRRNTEVNVGITYADYYFVEALLRYLQLGGESGVRVLEMP